MARKKTEKSLENSKFAENTQNSVAPQQPYEKSKLDILKEVVANERKREAEKQKQIYNAMSDFIYERKE